MFDAIVSVALISGFVYVQIAPEFTSPSSTHFSAIAVPKSVEAGAAVAVPSDSDFV